MHATATSLQACVLVLRLVEDVGQASVLPGSCDAVRAALVRLSPSTVSLREAPQIAVLDARPDSKAQLQRVLSADELAAMSRIVRPAARLTYGASHAALRLLMAHCCGPQAQSRDWITGPNGKPRSTASGSPHFSLSHSGAMFALAWGTSPVGVDIEELQPAGDGARDDWEAIAAQYFSAREQALLASAAPQHRRVSFLETWTRKEAVLKAAGLGIGQMEHVDTIESPVVSLDEDGVRRAYCVHSLAAGDHCRLAFAARLPDAST